MIKKQIAFSGLFILAVLLIAPAFETIDDCFMVQIVSGKYGHHPSELMLYSSPIYGKALVFLYHFIPSFNWYYFIFLLAHLVSWLVIMSVLFKYNENDRGLSLWTFFMLFATFGLYFLGNLQFTTTAFILALGGLLLILNIKTNRAILTGSIMILLATMIRLYSVWFLGCLVLPWLLYKWVLHDGISNTWNHKKTIFTVIVLGLATFAIWETGRVIYRQTESGKMLKSFLFERGKLIDNPNFVYTPANQSTYKEVNWTAEDYNMFTGYYFDPSPPFNAENLKYIHDHLKLVKPASSRIFTGIGKLFSLYPVYALFLLLIISAILMKRIGKKDIVFAFLQSGAVFLFLAYLLYFNDFKPRVIIPLFFLASLFIVMHILQRIRSLDHSGKKSILFINYSIVIFISVALFINFIFAGERRNNDKVLKNQIALINNIRKDLLVVHGYDLPVERASLSLFNNGRDLIGRVYFTMPSCFMHFLTGSKEDGKHISVFDLLCNNQETILLLHDDKTNSVADLLRYSSNKTQEKTVAYSRVVQPGLSHDLYLLNNQDPLTGNRK